METTPADASPYLPVCSFAELSTGMAQPRVESNTEYIVHDHFKPDELSGLIVEPKSTVNDDIKKLLKGGGKRKTADGQKTSGTGMPEFIITHPDNPHIVLVVECKKDVNKHESKDRNKPKDYAVDGVLHYAKLLKAQYDVVGVAVSGMTEETLKVSTFKWLRNAPTYQEMTFHGQPMTGLYRWKQYTAELVDLPDVRARRKEELLASSRKLHEYLYAKAKVKEEEKPLLVSACLIALTSSVFRGEWRPLPAPALAKRLYDALESVLQDENLPEVKRKAMLQPYSFIQTHPILTKNLAGKSTGPLHGILNLLVTEVWPFVRDYHEEDVLGHFYGEFLKYTAGDSKGLGIVLTPRHITELFADLAGVTDQSVVLDPCAGTGGFLISAMARMVESARKRTSSLDRETAVTMVKSTGLVGVEQMPHMFALAASNMFLRGDGKANLYQGDCFDATIRAAITTPKPADLELGTPERKRPTAGLINPPYAQEGDSFYELDFVKNMLDMLAANSLGIAIVPMSCATVPHPTRETILKDHTLVAVMSMPDELFPKVGTVTCIMVFQAHTPHDPDVPSWFGYWKNDGFIKTRTNGRCDLNNQWPSIRQGWLDDFRSRNETPGRCVKHKVTAADEWCAEAYMSTDYSTLNSDAFVSELRKYAVFKMLDGEVHAEDAAAPKTGDDPEVTDEGQ